MLVTPLGLERGTRLWISLNQPCNYWDREQVSAGAGGMNRSQWFGNQCATNLRAFLSRDAWGELIVDSGSIRHVSQSPHFQSFLLRAMNPLRQSDTNIPGLILI